MAEIVNCIGCGLCSSLKGSPLRYCNSTGTLNPFGLDKVEVDEYCPLLVDYKKLYRDFYHEELSSKQLGRTLDITIAYSKDPIKRLNGASGGAITEIFSYLLSSGQVDAVIGAYQPQIGDFRKVHPKIITDPDDLVTLSGSIYITVPMLEILSSLDPKLKYAISLVPEQTAVLRKLQIDGNQQANSIKFIAGLMTGTTLKTTDGATVVVVGAAVVVVAFNKQIRLVVRLPLNEMYSLLLHCFQSVQLVPLNSLAD